MRYYLIAGEASGDLHGGILMKALAEKDPQARFRFRGGDSMLEAGGELFRHYKDTAVMGITEVAAKAGRILADMAATKEDIAEWKPDVLILIDYPGFNLRMAKFAHGKGFKVFYYIPPKLWARGERRIAKVRKYVDEVFVIFPFEVEYYKSRGVNVHYFGNPLAAQTGSPSVDRKVIALLPGSRQAELKWLMPRFVEMEQRMAADPRWAQYRLVIAAAPNMTAKDFAAWLPADSRIEVRFGKAAELFAESRSAVISSGTASLEAALAGVPQVVCYGFSRVTWLIAKHTVKVKFISLANLIVDKLIFKELIQNDSSVDSILSELERLTFDKEYRAEMQQGYDELRAILSNGNAVSGIAGCIFELLKDQ